MTTPRIEEILSKVPRSFTITTHEEHPYSSEYVDIEDMRQALTKAHQAGDKEGYERGKKAGRDEAVEIVKKHSYCAKFGFNTTAETIAISPSLGKRICDTDDTIKALTDNK